LTKQWIALLAVVVCCPPAVFAQEAMGPPKPSILPTPSATNAEPMEEVEIRGTRARLRELREEIVRLEDRFYQRFNDLNTDDQYDVHCNMEQPTGTLLRYRVCKPEFVETATSEEAKAFLGGYSVAPANMIIMAKYPDFEKAALSVINKDRDLRRLIRERDAVEARYENLRRIEFGEEPKVEEKK
jgi:hypothetical protein